jgi:hypothetical protein
MSTRVRKRVPARSDQRGAGLRRDVQEAIDRVWPDGVFVDQCVHHSILTGHQLLT